MRIANLDARLVLLTPAGAVDVERASAGRFGADPQGAYADWEAFTAWAATVDPERPDAQPADPARLGPPVPRPRQVFASALNYSEHAAEAERAVPDAPLVFTKFPTCLSGPVTTVTLPTPKVDWEIELVAVIGREAVAVDAADALDHVAGVTVGQDLSARDVQRRGPAPQFSLAKSFPGFGPTGPSVVTLDELELDALELECRLNGDVVQRASVGEMVFGVAALLAHLSHVCPLLPGDLVFTGTPAGVGARRDPPRFLREGDVLESTIAGVGRLTQTFAAAQPAGRPTIRIQEEIRA